MDDMDEFKPFPLGEALLMGMFGWGVGVALFWWFVS
jgi:hypothetical protein